MALGASGRVVTASSLLQGPRGAPLLLLSRGTLGAVRDWWLPEGSRKVRAILSGAHAKFQRTTCLADAVPSHHPGIVRRLTTCLLPACPCGLHPATSCPHPFSGPESHLELFPSCIPLFQGTLAWGVSSSPGTGCAGSSLPACPSAPERDSGRSC